MAPSPSPAAAAAAAVAAAEDAAHTEVQCVTRETLERTAQELALSRSALWQLQNSIATEEARMAARVQSTLSKQAKEHADAQADADKRLRKAMAMHNAEVASLHKKFGEAAGTAAERARQRQGQLEAALRKEIRNHDQLSGELASVRDKAAEELAALSVAVEASREERERLDEQAVEMIEEVKAGYEADLATLEAECEARQLQLLDEYDTTLAQERHAATSAAETAATEIKSLQMQQYMQRKKLEQHAKEKEKASAAVAKVEERAEELVRQVADLEAQIANLKGQAASREGEVADRDRKIVAMHASSQRLESTKQLLELRVKELEETHEPMLAQLSELATTTKVLEKELIEQGDKRREVEVEVERLMSREKHAQAALRKAEQRALDAAASHAATVAKVYQLLESGAPLSALAEYVRNRDRELRDAEERRRLGGDAAGPGGGGGGGDGSGRTPWRCASTPRRCVRRSNSATG